MTKQCFNPREQIQNGMSQASVCPSGRILTYNVTSVAFEYDSKEASVRLEDTYRQCGPSG